MPNWDNPRGPRHGGDRDRWRRGATRDRGERRSPDDESRWRADPYERDRRGEERGMEAWRRDRYGARYDQERSGYGGFEDAGSAGYARRRGEREDIERYGGEPYASGGQEYGLEGHGGFAGGGSSSGAGWGFDHGGGERRRNFDFDDPGVGQSQAGYGGQARSHADDPGVGPGQADYGGEPRSHPDHDFDLDYLRWRDEQLRAHDRDYEAWRRDQHRQYDEQYRQFRSERQRHFGQAFHEWRSQRSAVGGVPDTSVAPGVSGYGDKTAVPGGYNAPSAFDKPSGALDPPGHLSADPAMSQRGSPEFGREPPQLQASSEGETQRQRRDDNGGSKGEDVQRH